MFSHLLLYAALSLSAMSERQRSYRLKTAFTEVLQGQREDEDLTMRQQVKRNSRIEKNKGEVNAAMVAIEKAEDREDEFQVTRPLNDAIVTERLDALPPKDDRQLERKTDRFLFNA